MPCASVALLATGVRLTVFCTAADRYARRSKEARLEWGAFTQAYFLERPTLAAVLLLVDASVPPQQLDLVCVDWLAEAEVRCACLRLGAGTLDTRQTCDGNTSFKTSTLIQHSQTLAFIL